MRIELTGLTYRQYQALCGYFGMTPLSYETFAWLVR